MTSVFDTHPPQINIKISYVKEIRFWNKYPPTFYVNVLECRNPQFIFLTTSLNQDFQITEQYILGLNWKYILCMRLSILNTSMMMQYLILKLVLEVGASHTAYNLFTLYVLILYFIHTSFWIIAKMNVRY